MSSISDAKASLLFCVIKKQLHVVAYFHRFNKAFTCARDGRDDRNDRLPVYAWSLSL
jgi:hypothetical protein